MGVLQTELLRRDKAVYAQEVHAEGKEIKFADMRFEHFERRRQELWKVEVNARARPAHIERHGVVHAPGGALRGACDEDLGAMEQSFRLLRG